MYKLCVSLQLVKVPSIPDPPDSERSVDPVERDGVELSRIPRALEKMVDRMYPSSPVPGSPAVTLKSSQTYDVPNDRYVELLEILSRFDKLACEIGAPAIEGMPQGPFFAPVG